MKSAHRQRSGRPWSATAPQRPVGCRRFGRWFKAQASAVRTTTLVIKAGADLYRVRGWQLGWPNSRNIREAPCEELEEGAQQGVGHGHEHERGHGAAFSGRRMGPCRTSCGSGQRAVRLRSADRVV
jgi:hypothetical protein